MTSVASSERKEELLADPTRRFVIDPIIGSLQTADAFLRANDNSYSYLVGRIARHDPEHATEKYLESIGTAANFACNFHTGRFSDGALENVLLEIGRRERAVATFASAHKQLPEAPLHILHVASRVQAIGGHTRMLHRWISEDQGNRHSIALTRQNHEIVPAWLSDGVKSSGGEVLALGELPSDLARAFSLRSKARELADLVVVHHFGDDIVPTLAFATHGGPPVAILNHADHMFWLGASVADLCIDLRSITNAYSISRRYIPNTIVLPIPLPAPVKCLDRKSARKELGIDADELMLLTVARSLKFRPCGGQDFLATVETVLNENRNIHLYVIGESRQGMVRQLSRPLHPRIHCLGTIENTGLYRAAADVYIESFPFGSNTSLLEAALDGLPVVPACRPLTKLVVASNDSLTDLLTNPADEAEYAQRIKCLANDPAGRRAFGQSLRNELLKHHVGLPWKAHLDAVYRAAAELVHQPGPIPVTRCETTPCDIGLSLFSAIANGRSTNGTDPPSPLGALRHSAFVAKHARDFGTARALSFSALRADVLGLQTWRLFLASLLGPVARRAGETMRRKRRTYNRG